MASPVDLAPLRAALDLDAKATAVEWRTGSDGYSDPAHASPHEIVALVPSRATAYECNLGRFNPHVDGAENAAAAVAMHNAAPALRAALDELERLRADARRHADARAALFDAYLRAGGDPTIRAALRTFFNVTEEP